MTFRKIFIIIGLMLVVATLVLFFRTQEVLSLVDPPLPFGTEFSSGGKLLSFEQTQQVFARNMNCIFNTAIQSSIELKNKQFTKSVKESQPSVHAPQDAELGCAEIAKYPIASRLLQELRTTLSVLPTNQENPSKKTLLPDTEQMLKCNFVIPTLAEAQDQGKVLSLVFPKQQTSPQNSQPHEVDYFRYKRSLTLTPAYAVTTVAGCYRQMYDQYLRQYFLGVSPAVQTERVAQKTSGTAEKFQQDQRQREELYLDEMERVRRAYEVSVSALDQVTKSYPLHTLYEQIIAHSQEVRDQFRRWRIATDQLVPKLINQTTRDQ